MPAPRPFALIRTKDQWSRVAHHNTALEGEVVQLAWSNEACSSHAYDDATAPDACGLAFDAHCLLYHSVPVEGRVERLWWIASDPLKPGNEEATPFDLFAAAAPAGLGDFNSTDEMPAALVQP